MSTTHDEKHAEHGSPSRPFRGRARGEDMEQYLRRQQELQQELFKLAVAPKATPWPSIAAGVASAIALLFTGLTFLSSSTQDKVDRGTAPLNVMVNEMDKRVTGRLDSIDKNVEKISTRVESIESRLSTIEGRLERIDSKLK